VCVDGETAGYEGNAALVPPAQANLHQAFDGAALVEATSHRATDHEAGTGLMIAELRSSRTHPQLTHAFPARAARRPVVWPDKGCVSTNRVREGTR
jgi:hypothetical protein